MNRQEESCTQASDSEIAVIGMAGRFPGARNIEEFWENLKNGVESISHFSDEELEEAGISPEALRHPNYVKAKGILEDIDAFDADFFGYPPREAERMDPQIRILHECSWEALEKAGYIPDSFKGLIGFYVGANENQEWLRRVQSLQTTGDVDSFLLNYRDYVATRISNKLDLKGPSCTLLTACSTSMVAIHLACQALTRGECDMALAGGVSLSLPRKSGYFYQEGLMVSADGHCRTFDAKASGTVFGDGVGIVVLKSLKEALEARDHIHAIVKGSAINNDGNGKAGFTAPSVNGQKMVILAAHRVSRIEKQSIGYIETHGTGTKLGDPIEMNALEQVFKTDKKKFCKIGSVKTNIGHVNIAAGVSSFIKTVLALEHGMIPPSLHFKRPNPEINFKNSPFIVNTKLTKWDRNGYPRRAGVSAFGFGGTNAHIVLEEAPRNGRLGVARPWKLLVLSARTESALNVAAANLTDHLKEHPDLNLDDVAFTQSVGRKHSEYRRVLVCRDNDEVVKGLDRTVISHVQELKENALVFMFPGQGAQTIGMGKALYQREPSFRYYVDTCSEILKSHLGLDIREILYPSEGDTTKYSERLKQTTIAQPAIFTISYALARVWMKWGVRPKALIGHSIGEYVAACLANVFTLEDALFLVAKRGQFMQQLPRGGMLVVPFSEDKLNPYLDNDISLAAVNSPSLSVLSGPDVALKQVEERLREKDVDCHYLHTSHAFHSKMVEPVLQPLTRLLRRVQRQSPQIPIVSTVTGDWVSPSEMTKPEYWIKNLRQTVRFSAAIRKLLDESNSLFLEVGPGKTLSILTQMHRENGQQQRIYGSLANPGDSNGDEFAILNTVGQLWLTGIQIDWSQFYSHEERHRVPLPTYPFERQHFWLGSIQTNPRSVSRWDLLHKNPDMAEWFHIPSWRRAMHPVDELDCQSKFSWLIFMDDCGLGCRIARRLKECNQDVVAVYRGRVYGRLNEYEYTLNPENHDDYDVLFTELGNRKKLPHRIIHLWNIYRNKQNHLDLVTAERAQNLGFYSLLSLAQVIGKQNITDEVHIGIVSNNIHDVMGEERIYPEKTPVVGLVKVIPQEYPNVQCSNIDFILSQDDDMDLDLLIEPILAEVLKNSMDPIVAYRGNYRWIQHYEQVSIGDLSGGKYKFRRGGVTLITGGLGGIGLVLASYLGHTAKAKLILTGRSPLPDRKEWKKWLRKHEEEDKTSQRIRKILEIEKCGSEVLVVAADVTDEKRMREELTKAIGHFGTIHGVIHAAGLPGEGIIQLKRHEIAENILAPKIQGTIILNDILKDFDLDFFVLCSSIASILGGIGLADYCSANSFLDGYASYQRSRNKPFVAINWDMWGEVGMGLKTKMPDELQTWLEKELRDGITTKEGIEVFRRILSWGQSSNVIVSTRDLQSRIDLWIKREFIKEKERAIEKASQRPKYKRPNLSTGYKDPVNTVEKKITEIWRKLFGIDRIGRQDNFYELGGHSLLATTLVNQLKKEFDTNLSIRDVLDHPTVSQLAEMIGGKSKSILHIA